MMMGKQMDNNLPLKTICKLNNCTFVKSNDLLLVIVNHTAQYILITLA